MAKNFQVNVINKYSSGLFLRIMGDFDGSSAYKLTGLLKQEGKGLSNIVIDTDGLSEVHPFGREIFNNNIKKLGINIKYLGRFKNAFDH
jgi:anti-anti-sigma regulatory factor